MTPDDLKNLIQSGIAGAEVFVQSDDNVHFATQIISDEFVGKSPVKQHQLVYAALGDAFKTALHALSIQTYTRAEWEALAATMIDLDVRDGDLDDVTGATVAVSTDAAEANGWTIGSPIDFQLVGGPESVATVAAIYDSTTLAGDHLMSAPYLEGLGADVVDDIIVVDLADGVTPEEGRAAVTAAVADRPAASVLDREEFKDLIAEYDRKFGDVSVRQRDAYVQVWPWGSSRQRVSPPAPFDHCTSRTVTAGAPESRGDTAFR